MHFHTLSVLHHFLAACIKSLIPVPMEQIHNKKNGQEGQKLPIVTGLPQTLTAIIEVLLLNGNSMQKLNAL